MPKLFPVVVKRSQQVGDGSANATWTDTTAFADPVMLATDLTLETISLDETQTLEFLTDQEAVDAADLLLTAGSVEIPDTIQADEIPVIQFPQPESVQASDLWTPSLVVIESAPHADDPFSSNAPPQLAIAEGVQFSETGSIVALVYPDQQDTWLNQASASSTHGGEVSMLAKGASTVPGSDEERAYMAFDLTKFTGWSGDPNAGNPGLLTFQAKTSNNVLNTTLNLSFRRGTSQPFTESTATWTGQSASLASYGTQWATTTKSIAKGGGLASYSIFINDTNLTDSISDGWLLVTFTTAGGAAPDTVTITTKEAASGKPNLTLNLIR